MLDNILKNIDGKAKQEAEKILEKKQDNLLELEKGFKKDFDQKKKAELVLLEQHTEKEIEEAKQELKLVNSFKLGRAKKQAAIEVYQKAVEKIEAFDDHKFNQLIEQLFSGVPEVGAKGDIVAGARTANALKKIVGPEVVIKQELNEEGFVVKAKDLDIDVRISETLALNKEKTDPQIMEALSL